jgi:hypothetical protein
MSRLGTLTRCDADAQSRVLGRVARCCGTGCVCVCVYHLKTFWMSVALVQRSARCLMLMTWGVPCKRCVGEERILPARCTTTVQSPSLVASRAAQNTQQTMQNFFPSTTGIRKTVLKVAKNWCHISGNKATGGLTFEVGRGTGGLCWPGLRSASLSRIYDSRLCMNVPVPCLQRAHSSLDTYLCLPLSDALHRHPATCGDAQCANRFCAGVYVQLRCEKGPVGTASSPPVETFPIEVPPLMAQA